ncbi:M24 family metallopeptidase [Breznakiella homolactica]|uniref:Aminopeptidase P family protein n=1 Tax=Breznakiella homolactica TaxID=2798577 RepID=A0A7T7XN66_9SPIR|nr:Xaa-Pro peptidase family protein [Breznakiella homolactica]QQO09435.1 Xaa-Pro peptidase family protein [Breznakiella homolactica]
MNSCYEARRERIYDWMAQEGIALVMFEDTEGRRDTSIRWMTGHPGDALLFLAVDKRSLLVPWDINMAKLLADTDMVVPYTEFERSSVTAIRSAAEYFKIPFGSRIEIPSVTPYVVFLKYVEALMDFDVVCREWGATEEVAELRAVKDSAELEIYETASSITNEVITLLEGEFKSGGLKTETDVALFIEAEARKRGCEGTGFETIAAGPSRSFGIHAFPTYTGGPFGGQGLSVLDFGLKYKGYTTDVTITVAKGPLTKPQETMLAMVEKAYTLALEMVKDGVYTRDIAVAVDNFFRKSKKAMPHALGHGIGLQAHEAPAVRSRQDNQWQLRPGMIITLEPGLYDPEHGGCRLENDVLLTESGPRVLTKAAIVRL